MRVYQCRRLTLLYGDEVKLKTKLGQGKPYLNIAKQITERTLQEFLERFDLQLQGERVFEVLSQIILDVCTHIVSNSPIGVPQTYSDCISKLTELGVLPSDQKRKFISLIKMRNLIVHQYGTIDYEILYKALEGIQQDFAYLQNQIIHQFNLENS